MNHGVANGKSLMARGHKALAINWGHLLLGARLVICRIPVSHQSPSTVIWAKSQWVRRTITRYRGFNRMIYFCWTWVNSQQNCCHAQILVVCIQSLDLLQVRTRMTKNWYRKLLKLFVFLLPSNLNSAKVSKQPLMQTMLMSQFSIFCNLLCILQLMLNSYIYDEAYSCQ